MNKKARGRIFLFQEIENMNQNLNGKMGLMPRKLGSDAKSFLYFWGFRIQEPGKQKDDYLVYYCGVYQKNNIVERLMQHFAMLFGGYYTIINMNHLIEYKYQPRIRQFELLKAKITERNCWKGDKELSDALSKNLLYTSESLNWKKTFINGENEELERTKTWMRDNLFGAYVEFAGEDGKKWATQGEKYIHDLLGINILGGRNRTKLSGRDAIRKIIESNKNLNKNEKNLTLELLLKKLNDIEEIKKWIESSVNSNVNLKESTSTPYALGDWWSHGICELEAVDFALTRSKNNINS